METSATNAGIQYNITIPYKRLYGEEALRFFIHVTREMSSIDNTISPDELLIISPTDNAPKVQLHLYKNGCHMGRVLVIDPNIFLNLLNSYGNRATL